MIEGKKHGCGNFYSEQGGKGIQFDQSERIQYDGNFDNDVFNGVGTFYYPGYHAWMDQEIQLSEPTFKERIYYKGNFKDGEFCGFGIMHFSNNTQERGEWASDQKLGMSVDDLR